MELKAHWDFSRYMLRSERGIEMLVNLQTIAYASTKLLPLVAPELQWLRDMSAQDTRFEFGCQIRHELFLEEVKTRALSLENSSGFLKTLRNLLRPKDRDA